MLTDLQQKKITALFRRDDMDGDGFLEREDLERWATVLGKARGWHEGSPEYEALYSYQLQLWTGLQQAADKSGDDKISLDELLDIFGGDMVGNAEALAGTGSMMFRVLDADADGKIAVQEYQQFLSVASHVPNPAENNFPRLDLNGDGFITHDEFRQLYQEFFTSNDPDAPGNWLFGPY